MTPAQHIQALNNRAARKSARLRFYTGVREAGAVLVVFVVTGLAAYAVVSCMAAIVGGE